MKKNLTEFVFILDRGGSMAWLEDDTIGGFNAMIEKQKREPGEALASTVLFDNENVVIHDRADIQRVKPMTRKAYHVRAAFSVSVISSKRVSTADLKFIFCAIPESKDR